jgi:hypothetical protein
MVYSVCKAAEGGALRCAPSRATLTLPAISGKGPASAPPPIEQLPPDLRLICPLRDVLHYLTKDVSRRLRISNVAVRLRLFRAHALLRDRLLPLRAQKKAASAPFRENQLPSVASFCPAPGYCGD